MTTFYPVKADKESSFFTAPIGDNNFRLNAGHILEHWWGADRMLNPEITGKAPLNRNESSYLHELKGKVPNNRIGFE